MALSLGFHIVFAEIGIAMPVLMVLAEWRWMKTGDDVYRQLARRWAKGTAVLFAVGAVSGTVLSFELGLLWPRFMAYAGPIIGMPFSLEGFAFFLGLSTIMDMAFTWFYTRPLVILLGQSTRLQGSGAFSIATGLGAGPQAQAQGQGQGQGLPVGAAAGGGS